MMQERRKYLLPGEKKSESIPWKLLGICSIPSDVGLAATLSRLPWGGAHFGLLLASVIASLFLCWTVRAFSTGIYHSQQGTYDRRKQPLRYWLHALMISFMTVLSGAGWVIALREVWTGG